MAKSPEKVRAEKTKPVTIRIPLRKPERVMIQPRLRPGSKQYTCIRFDNEGQYFVDQFVERSQATPTLLAEGRRMVRHVSCPLFYFEVALGTCHHYCAFPCSVHLDVVKEWGWYTGGSGPTIGRPKPQGVGK
jgi:hypothetical protein